jgi:hypothetical protein
MRVRESGYLDSEGAAGMSRRKNALLDLKYHAPTKQYCVYLGDKRKSLGRDEAIANANYRHLLRDLMDGAAQPAASGVNAVPAETLTVAELPVPRT